jgi:hypothetical protein
LGVNDSLSLFHIPVAEDEIPRVDEWTSPCGRLAIWAGVDATEKCKRIKFFDGWETPIGVAADSALGCTFHNLSVSLFGTGIASPHQTSVQIGHGAVSIVTVGWRALGNLSVLTVKRFTGFRWRNYSPFVVKTLCLSRRDDGVGKSGFGRRSFALG